MGLVSLSLLYIVVCPSLYFAPLTCSYFGDERTMVFGAVLFAIYMVSLVIMEEVVLWISSCLIGFGAAILWVAQGACFVKCCDDTNRGLHSAIFWGTFQISGILGQLGAFFLLNNSSSHRCSASFRKRGWLRNNSSSRS